MSKREIATLVDALRLNTRILNEKLREQELIKKLRYSIHY